MSSQLVRKLIRQAAVLAALAAAPTVLGQRFVLDDGAASGTADPQQGVYVRDSAAAADKFELGKRMERLREWHKSADVYQEILEKYQDRVVPTQLNDKQQAIRYASVTVAVRERLSRWPQEGLTVYRARYEPVAAQMLEQAGHDEAALHRILDLYCVTEAAKTAGIRLMDRYLEKGEFAVAGWIGDRLLEWHPSLVAERPAVLFRTATAYHLAGNAAAAAARAQQLRKDFADAAGVVAGKDRLLAEALTSQMQGGAATATGLANDSWRTIGGDPSRSLIPAAGGIPGARVYSIELPGPLTLGMSEQSRQAMLAQHEQARSLGLTINVMPAVDRGELYFQDGYRIHAVQLESGVPLSAWAQTYGGEQHGQFWITTRPGGMVSIDRATAARTLSPPRQHTLTLTDDSVLAVMGDPDPRAKPNIGNGQDVGASLVCLWRSNGKPRWIIPPATAGSDAATVSRRFSGSPLVVGDNVYVLVRSNSNAGVEDCSVHCYALDSGALRWTCYIASSQAANPNMMFGPMGGGVPMNQEAALSHLAYASGRLFVLTNLGAVASVDAYSGATAWLTIYPREARDLGVRRAVFINPGLVPAAPRAQSDPWSFNPVVVSDGRAFALPSDGRFIHVYDAATGEELKRIPVDIEFQTGNATRLTMLLGASGERIWLAGNDRVLCLNWTQYNRQDPNSRVWDREATVWSIGPYLDDQAISGRPFLSGAGVYIPTRSFLTLVNPRGSPVLRYPRAEGRWAGGDRPDAEGPGNVLVTPDHVIIANDRNVSVYTDLGGVRKRYELALQLNPDNIEARLVFAELMFNARETEPALQALDEAITLLGGRRNMRPGPLRDRVFTDAMTFAQKSAEARTEASIALAQALYDRAASAAENTAQHVQYRLGHARFLQGLRSGDVAAHAAAATGLYQEILLDPQMRAHPVGGERGGSIPAARVAHRQIAELIARAGPGVYRPFEQQAETQLSTLSNTTDTAALVELADRFPHSAAAAHALFQAARLCESAGQPRQATLVLRRLYAEHASQVGHPMRIAALEALARNYLRLGNIGAAFGRLQQAGKEQPTAPLSAPLTLKDGRPLLPDSAPATVGQATEALRGLARQQWSDLLPDPLIPRPPTRQEALAGKPRPRPFLPQTGAWILPNVQAIVEAPPDLPGATRHDRLLAWSNASLLCLSPKSPQPLWSANALSSQPLAIAWLNGRLLAWSEAEVTLLDGDSGKALWTSPIASLAPATQLADAADDRPPAPQPAAQQQPQQVEQVARLQVQGGLVLRQVAGRRIVVQGGNNIVVLNDDQPVQAAPADGRERILHVRPVVDRCIVSTTAGRIAALNLESGQVLWQTRLPEGQLIQQLLANDDFTAVRSVEAQEAMLIVLDSFTGQPVYRRTVAGPPGTGPVNAALSPDGVLVWTTPVSMAAKDLYEGGDEPTWEKTSPADPHRDMIRPDQLIIRDEQIFALINNGQFISRRSLRTGEESAPPQSTGGDATTRLRFDGPRMYAFSNRSAVSYHVEDGTSTAMKVDSLPKASSVTSDPMTSIPAAAAIARDFVIVPGVVRDDPASPYYLRIFRRDLLTDARTGKRSDSGLMDYWFELTEPARIKQWATVDGGVYYLSGDNRLHLLQGSRP